MARKTITGLGPQAEQVTQERMMLASAGKIESAMRAELERVWVELIKTANDTGATAAVLAEHGERVAAILTANWFNIWSQFGRRILTGAMKHHHGHEIKREVPLTPIFDLARINWVNLFGGLKITQIVGTTADQALRIINQAMADAVADGLSEIQTGALIQARMLEVGAQLTRLRSRVIARTEAHSASTAATQAAAEATEIPMKREWVSSMGERTRRIGDGAAFDHAAANGLIVGMNEPFIVPGKFNPESIMYPGDPNGSAGNIINCRCICAYIPT